MGLTDLLRIAAYAGVLVLAVGCGDDPGPAVPEEPAQSASSDPKESPSGELAGPVDAAVADLAKRLDVPADRIEVRSARAVTWRDGSLGCPEEGKLYSQALVEGHQVVLEVDGRTFPYHSGGDRGPFLCEHLQPSTPPPASGGSQ